MKKRLDILLVEKGMAETRTKAQALILSGKVRIADKIIDKCGTMVDENSNIIITEEMPFVSRGGIKLDYAINEFNLRIEGKVALDIGASTGGFTDCLLKRGAKKVYAIDVGHNQFDPKLRKDTRIILIEKFNARYISKEIIPEKIDIITIDVSFISIKKILPALKNIDFFGYIIALIKPEFEAERKYIKKGIVKDEKVHSAILEDIISYSKSLGFNYHGYCKSPIKGAKGNVEYFILLTNKTNKTN